MAYRIDVDRGNKRNVSIDAIFETCGGIQKLAIVESGYLDETLERIAELDAEVDMWKKEYNGLGALLDETQSQLAAATNTKEKAEI